MDSGIAQFVAALGRDLHLAGDVVHTEHIPPRPAEMAAPNPPLPGALARALAARGVDRLYSHQARALAVVRGGRDVAVATPTASGKSLVYALPVLERLMADPRARTLMLFPLKALEQDQMAALNELAFAAGMGPVAAIYDGDTPAAERKRLRDDPPPVLISNPDMLHLGVCAFPDAWQKFLASLAFVVIDEVHTYRGVFGGHVVQVLRRLLRLCARAGSSPRFVLSSATIANPGEHAAALTGRKFAPDQVVDQSGAPAAGRHFVLINPAGAPTTSAGHLVRLCVERGLATICFTKSRLYTELIHARLTRRHPELRGRIAGYRAGFLPGERRRIERALSSGRLSGVITTSALEMGIDIGGLDACVLVGYPGSQINTWQRGGRVGRAGRQSAIFMVAGPDALDQYLISHPEEFFARPVEAAVLDADNRHIVAAHLPCAAAEEPLGPDEAFFDLKRHAKTVAKLEKNGELLRDASGELLFAARKRPQRFVDLRGAGEAFALVTPEGKVVGSMDGVRVFKEGYPGAVYLHQTRSYIVRHLDIPNRRVVVAPVKADFFTKARSDKETEILEETGRRPHANFLARKGRLKVTETITGFERRRLSGGELLGVFPLDLPPQPFETFGLWIDIENVLRAALEAAGHHFMGSIHALEHAAIAMFPLFALCDRADIGGISIPLHPQTKKAAVFIYDGVPGGVGLAERGFDVLPELLAKVEELLAACPCEDGCPACVYSPKCGSGNKPLDKAGALFLTRLLLGKEALPAADEEPPAPVILASPEPGRDPSGAMRYGVLDLETQRLAGEVGGWGNSHLMLVSVAVLYDSAGDGFTAYSEDELPALLRRLEELELVVGFNIKRFDYKVLGAYTPRDLLRLPTLDLLEDVHRHLGFRLSLDSLAGATLGAAKSADGLKAVEWWRNGEHAKLMEYCKQDVALTRDLLLHGQEHGHLLYERKDGPLLRVPVDWGWEALRKRLGR